MIGALMPRPYARVAPPHPPKRMKPPAGPARHADDHLNRVMARPDGERIIGPMPSSSGSDSNGRPHVIVVGGGFAGVACVRRLARVEDMHVTLVDRNNYHQFQPLLYQVATSQLASSDIAYSLRKLFRDNPNVDVKLGEVRSMDPVAHRVETTDGEIYRGHALVLAAGSQPNFFRTPGAE